MEEPSSREAASFIRKSGFTKPGYQALLALKEMKDRAKKDVDSRFTHYHKQYVAGGVNVWIGYDAVQDWCKINVWTTRFPDEVYDYFLTGEDQDEEDFDKRMTKHVNSLNAKDPARIVSSVNSLARKVADDREKYIILADVRKKLSNLPKGVPEKWNEESRELGLWPPGGFQNMNLKQTKVLAAWVEGKLTGLKAQKESLARQVVFALLEEEPQEYTRYFDTRVAAAGYQASLVMPHKYLKVVESEVEDFVAYLRAVPDREMTDRDFVYKDATDPKTRNIGGEAWTSDDENVFHVYARRAPKEGKLPWIGKIGVEHSEQGKPNWYVHSLWGETWPASVDLHPTRLDAAKILWKHYLRSGQMKRILPAFDEPEPF